MSRADTVVRVEATESILMPPSSRTLASRCSSLVRCSISFLRYAEARIMPMPDRVARDLAVAAVVSSA
jgi:hypothetical protein